MIHFPIKKVLNRFTGQCDGGTEYEMQEGSRTTVGSEITLYLNEDSLEFANEYRAREVLEQILLFHAGRDLPFQSKCRAGV